MGLNPQAIKWQAILLNSFPLKFLPQKWIDFLLGKVHKGLSKKIRSIPNNPKLHQKVREAIQDQSEHFDRIGLDLGYAYEEGAIISGKQAVPKQGVSEYTPSIEAGVRFPHFWIGAGEKRISSHSWLAPDSFTLLCNEKASEWWMREKEKLPASIQSLIQQKNVEALLSKSSLPAFVESMYPIDKVALLLIRPDGQIAWRAESLDIDISSVFSQLIPSL